MIYQNAFLLGQRVGFEADPMTNLPAGEGIVEAIYLGCDDCPTYRVERPQGVANRWVLLGERALKLVEAEVTCPVCRGRRTVDTEHDVAGVKDWCAECGGTGRVVVTQHPPESHETTAGGDD